MCALWSPKRPASSWSPKCESSGWWHERVRKSRRAYGPTSPTRCFGRGNRMSEFEKVAVLMGGPSSEREISFLSGNAVLAALKSRGVDAHAFDPAERALCELKPDGFERVFIALHGRFGEDGTVQGALEVLGIPYTRSGVMASALCMDKVRTKMVWLAGGLPTPRYEVITERSDWSAVAKKLTLPLIVKPAHEGSTLGLT